MDNIQKIVLKPWGLLVDGDCDTTHVSDQVFHPLIEPFQEIRMVLTDTGCHAKEGDLQKMRVCQMKVCQRGTWNEHTTVETVLSLLHGVCHLKQIRHRLGQHLKAPLAFALAAVNICVQWSGFPMAEEGYTPLAMAQLSL